MLQSVSYTHLDVYKRQVNKSGEQGGIPCTPFLKRGFNFFIKDFCV